MNFLNRISIRARLTWTTFLTIFILAAFIFYSLVQMQEIGKVANDIYEHPLRVSNAALTASWNATRMHRSMKDIVLSDNEEELNEAAAKVDEAEREVFAQLDIIKEYIIGEEGQELEREARELFSAWKPIREEVIALAREGKKEEAGDISKGKSAAHFEKVTGKKQELHSYARHKADEFIAYANRKQHHIIYHEIVFIIGASALLIVMVMMVFKSITASLDKLKNTMLEGAASDSPVEAEIAGRNEVVEMAKSFNTLVAVVRDHQENLEVLVKERTAELKESEERLATTLRSIGDAIIATDSDGIITFMNPVAEQLTRWTIDEAHGKPLNTVFKIVNEQTREPVDNPVAKVIETGDIVGLANHTVLIAKNGEEFPIVDSGAPIKDSAGEIRGVILVFRDDTERRNAEREVQQSRDWLSTTLRSIGDAVIATDGDGRVGFMNPVAEKLTGWQIDEAKGRPLKEIFNIVNEQTREPVENPVAKVIETGKIVGLANHTVLISKDGKEFPIVDSGAPIVNSEGKTTGVVLVFMDDTERRETEQQIIDSEKYYRELIINLQTAVVVHGTDTSIITANKAAQEYLGLTLDQLKGKKAIDPRWKFLRDDGTTMPIEEFPVNRVISSGKPIKSYTVGVFIPETGLIRWVYVSAYPVFSGQELMQVVVTFADITEARKASDAEKRLFEQEKFAVVGKVAGKMAHDFNNVLGIILGTSELILSDNPDAPIMEDIITIRDSALRGRDITRNLLIFAKDHEPKMSRFDLNEKIALLIKALKPELKDIAVSVNYGPNVDDVIADAGLLENAVINLVYNSIHAMSKTDKPQLTVRTFSEGDDVCIVIEDNGCGIPDEYKDKIFEPTVTLKGSNDRAGAYRADIKGTGYGLANVKRCIDKHGGTITFESEAGKGTTFRLACRVVKNDITEEEMKQITVNTAEGKRILVVEDEPQLGRILYTLLGKFGHKAHLATDGAMAMDYLKNNEYDAVSLDFILPDMNGMKVYNHIREKDKTIPVIFVSGNFEFMQSMVDLKKEDPKVDHLAKPFDNVEYINTINKWLV